MDGYLTTKEVAARLNVSAARVRRMILDGIIKAEKFGRDNFVTEAETARVENMDRKHGVRGKAKKS
jgi:excisionase family DNA binding protein